MARMSTKARMLADDAVVIAVFTFLGTVGVIALAVLGWKLS